MQQILLCDDISVKWRPDASGVSSDDNSGIRISLSTNRHYLPNDQRNLDIPRSHAHGREIRCRQIRQHTHRYKASVSLWPQVLPEAAATAQP